MRCGPGRFPRIGPRRVDWLAIGVAALAGSAIVSAIFALHPRSAFLGTPFSSAGAFTFVGYAVLFFAVRRLRPNAAEMRLLTIAGLPAATAIIAYSLAQRFGLDPLPWDKDQLTRPLGTLGHPNHLAGYLALVLPIFIALGLDAFRRRDRLTLAATALVGTAGVWVLVDTICRTGWLSFAAAALVFVLLLALGRLHWRTSLTIGIVVTTLLLGSATWVLVRHGSATGEQETGSAFVLRTGTWDSRLVMWRDCLRVFAHYPLTGCGTDNLQLAFAAERSLDFVRLDDVSTPHRAHNLIIHLAATQGLLGLAAGLVLLVGIGAAVVAVVRQMSRRSGADGDDASRLWSAAAIAGLVAFVGNGMMSYTPLAIGVPTVIFAAILSVRARSSSACAAGPIATHAGYRWGFGLALVAIPIAFTLNFAATLSGWGWAAVLTVSAAIVWFGRRLLGSADGSAARIEVVARPALGFGRRQAVVFASWIGLLALVGWFVIAPFWSQRLKLRAMDCSADFVDRRAELFEEAIAWAPTDDELWMSLAEAENASAALPSCPHREKLAHIAAAERAATEAVRLSPLNCGHRFVLVAAQRQHAIHGPASWEPALVNMDAILARDSNKFRYRSDAVELALTANDPVRIRRWAEEGHARFPRCGEFPAAIGQLELKAGNNAVAEKWLEEACRGDWPAHVHCHMSMAANLLLVFKRLGEDKRICITAPQFLSYWPTLRPVRELYAEALMRRGMASEARSQYAEIMRLTSTTRSPANRAATTFP